MFILGISSATKVISLGLVEENKVLLETTLANVQTERIMFYLKEAGIEPKQIEGVAVAVGPGSYSGLRGGLATAKALAQTLNIPLASVSTLEAIAYNLIGIEGTIAVILDARADEYNFALFGASFGKLKRLTEDLVIKFEQLLSKLQKITGDIYLVGNLDQIRKENLLTHKNFHFADEVHSHPYGINVARIGWIRIKAGKIDDPLTLVPRYSHKPTFKEFNW